MNRRAGRGAGRLAPPSGSPAWGWTPRCRCWHQWNERGGLPRRFAS